MAQGETQTGSRFFYRLLGAEIGRSKSNSHAGGRRRDSEGVSNGFLFQSIVRTGFTCAGGTLT